MKVYGCRNNRIYGGGLVLVAANTIEEAYLTAAKDDKISYLFEWADDDYMWCEPDGNINHCVSEVYPLDKWFEVEHLSTDLTEPQIIIETIIRNKVMEAPDKIYIQPNAHDRWLGNKPNDNFVEYIRKDALLKYLRNEFDIVDFHLKAQDDPVWWGQRNAFQQVIDKIESLSREE